MKQNIKQSNQSEQTWASGESLTEIPKGQRYALRKYLPTGVYYLHVQISGKLYRESLQTQDKAEALSKRDARITEMKQSINAGVVTSDMTIGDLLAAAQADIAARMRLTKGMPGRLSRGGGRAYLSCIERLRGHEAATIEGKVLKKLPAVWGSTIMSTPVKTVTQADLKRWLLPLVENGYSLSIYNKTIQVLANAFKLLVTEKKLAYSPVTKMERAKIDDGVSEKQLPPESQLDALIEQIRQNKYNARRVESADVVFFLSRTGARIDETTSLLKSNVDLERTAVFPNGKITFSSLTTKNGKAKTIPILTELRPMLEKRLKMNSGSPRLFNIKRARKAIAGACERLELPIFTHHTFRHFFASILLTRGHYSIPEVAFLLGHRDGGITLQKTYAHIMPTSFNEKYSKMQIGTQSAPQLELTPEEEAHILARRQAAQAMPKNVVSLQAAA